MKNKKSQFKSMLSMLTLMLAMSVILTLPDAESNNSDSTNSLLSEKKLLTGMKMRNLENSP